MAPVVKALNQHPQIVSRVCVTAQHRQMLDQVLELFALQPDYDLNVMQPNQSLAQLSANALVKLDEVIRIEKPDWVLVQGDTTTAMIAALAAFYHHPSGVKVGHVEAGLRTWDKLHPFPEEANRQLVSVVADRHFAPTEFSRDNLLRESIPAERIVVTGNTVIDALLDIASRPYDWDASELAAIARDKRIVLVTAHRRENFGAPLLAICAALTELAARYADVQFVYPVHLNPNVKAVVHEQLGAISNITLLPPLEYLPLVQLLKHSTLVLTDSGGLQEEAPSLGKPVLVLRDVTERPEGVNTGTVKLVGTDQVKIVNETSRLLDDPTEYQLMSRAVNPYGDGQASQRIVTNLLS